MLFKEFPHKRASLNEEVVKSWPESGGFAKSWRKSGVLLASLSGKRYLKINIWEMVTILWLSLLLPLFFTEHAANQLVEVPLK